MTNGRVLEARRTSQDHALDHFSSSMALRYDGLDVRMVLLLYCFHAVFFSFPRPNQLNLSSLLYEQADWPMRCTQSAAIAWAWFERLIRRF